MEYSEDLKKMVKAHQGRFIGYGNPNAKILIIIPKATYKELMNIFEKIDSRETRIMLIGKLIWLKYEQRSWGLDYLLSNLS